jgi:hypothetical protein
MPSLQNYWYTTSKIPKINWLHPLARGLKFFAYPTQGGMTDLVSGKTGTLANGSRPATKTTKYGTVRYFAGGNLQFSGINHGIGTGPLTMWARHRWDGTSGSYKTPICINTNLTLYAPFSSTNRNLAADSTFGGQGSVVYSGTNVLTSGVWADVSIAFGGSSTSSTGYIDGKAQSTSSSMNYSNIGTTGHINVGMGQGTSEYARGDTKYAIVWGRKLSAEEQLFLTNFGPESLFIQPREFLFLADIAAGGATYTLSAESGSYSLAGTANALTASRKLTASSGSYAYTGTNAALSKTIVLDAATGAYVYTGTAASLVASRAITAASGTYNYTGTAAALLASRVITGGSGSYVYTGTNVTLTYNTVGSYTLTADSGAYNFSGTAAALTASHVLTAASGTYTYTGTNNALNRQYYITGESGSFLYTGTNTDLSKSSKLVASSGSFVYAGTSAALTYSGQEIWSVQSDVSTTWSTQVDETTTWTIQ